MADRMVDLTSKQPGFFGVESVRDPDGFGITVSYWESLGDISNWKLNSEHLVAQEKGKLSGMKITRCGLQRLNAPIR